MDISIILPTYNERRNIGPIVRQILSILPDAEIIIIDDNSPDKTGRIADILADKYGVCVIHRKKRLGLSTAVVAGFKKVKHDIIGVMDADLSHPPEMIPKLLEPILAGRSDFVIASRHLRGGGTLGWPIHRKLISRTATIMARKLTNVSDPMSGFFFLKKDVIKNIRFTSRGYKIGLEILVRGKYRKLKEIPYVFRGRDYGASKLNIKEYYKFLIDWLKLLS